MTTHVVYKYPLRDEESFALELPKNAEILCVNLQNRQPFLWAKVNPEAEKETRKFLLVGTGWKFEGRTEYIGTVFTSNGLVFHLFEIV